MLATAGTAAVTLALAATFAAVPAQASVSAATTSPPQLTADTNAPCNVTPKAGFVRCLAVVRTTTSHNLGMASSNQPAATALGPADIQSAYKLPALGSGQTVAIVDAYGDSHAEADLGTFRSQYGLPACTAANGCFRKVDQTGGTSYPADDPGWGLETSLDLDAVSAACPKCNILLVEGNSPSFSDLAAAVDEAVALGAKFISNSYGASDGAGDALNASYTHAGVAVVASTGDVGNVVQWPSAIGNVTAAGGTKLVKNTTVPRGWVETAWNSGGAGCSAAEPKPDYQNGVNTDCTKRAVADISADADPASGLATYDTLGQGGWMQVGGTSLASPLLTAMYAMAGAPVAGTYPVSYPYHDPNQSADLNDITEGTDGPCGNLLCDAGPGWDGPTGLGTPDGLGALSSGPQSVITGQATDTTTGKPIAGVTVAASPGNYQTRTDANGNYELDVAAGSYTVTGSMYAFKTATDSVQATASQKVTANLSLAELPHIVLSGTVKDGSGHGWPVSAEINIGGGYPGGPVYTDPFTGKYSVTVAAPATYPLTISASAPNINAPPGDGYQTLTTQVTAGTSDQTADFTLSVDKNACTALGYGYPGLSENFNSFTGTTPRDGWTVTGSQNGWRFDNPGNRPPPTMTTGNDTFAIADSGTSGGHMDTTLTSPAVDLSGQKAPVLSFQSEYYGATGQQGTIELSTDGGSSWTSVWHHATDNSVTTDPYTTIAIPAATGKHDVRVRFRYTGNRSWWWSVGNIHVGDPDCTVLPGGLVSGLVTDAGTGHALPGATVSSPSQGVSGVATESSDPGVTGALYSVFSPATGSQKFAAAASGYGSSTASVNVTADQLTRQDFALTASASAASHVTTSPLVSHATHAAASSASPGQLQPVTLPALHGKSYTITLITGDQIQLTATGTGRYRISATPSSAGRDQEVRITGVTSRKGDTTLQAMPSLATPLLTGSKVDPGLFDLAWLATHGDTGPDATLPVVLRSATPDGASALAKTAATLPGAKVTGTSTAAGTVQVTVPANRAAAFWAAVTGARALRPGQPATSLADGIAGISLAGHSTAGVSPRLAGDQHLYTVTENITGAPSGTECGPGSALCLNQSDFGMFGVTGMAADTSFPADTVACTSQTSSGLCNAYQVTSQVPAGVYLAGGFGLFDQGPDAQWLDMTIPQLTVTGDMSITIDASKARKLTVNTPRPSDSVSFATEAERVTPDGTMAFGFTIMFYGFQNEWVVSGLGEPVTTGTFTYSTDWVREAPVIAMSVAGTALHPWYPYYVDDPANPMFKRFKEGSQNLQLVDAGIGSAADFAKIDARGKLALVGLDPAAYGCLVESSQMTNALNAGAAGVIIDPTTPLANAGTCWMPVTPDWFYPASTGFDKPVMEPLVSVPQADAQHLRQLLAAGPVSINVNDSGSSGYQYDLKFYSEGSMPANPGYTVTAQDLAPVNTILHASAPGLVDWGAAVNRPDERFTVGGGAGLHAQATQTQYYGPISPAEVWVRNPEFRAINDIPMAVDVFSQSTPTTDDWFSKPASPGSAQVSRAAMAAQPGLWEPGALCAFCRQGDVFYPFYYRAGQDPGIQDGAYWPDAGQTHLYAGGQEIQPTTVGGFPAYNLPAGQTSYRLTMTDADTTTDWTYGSATPTANLTPSAYYCPGTALINSTAPCAPTPLILLRYNAFTSSADTVTAGALHDISVTPYYQEGSAPTTISSLRLWFSTDGGKTWQEVHVTAHDGSYDGHYQLPSVSATNGSVSLKVQATDSAGSTVSQTVLNDYSITG